MQITINSQENIKGEVEARMVLEFDGKKFEETWKKFDDGSYRTLGKGIISQMEDEDIAVEGTELEEILNSIDVSSIIDIVQEEEGWI